ncbi:ethylbenzene dehydrogenase-related protein [Agarivorans sp. Alg241-V36]|uniref:ethylbenzene dehydrogenase-related protein n=1 Tax=Agarivorans sp. Alg241-V36 TaxID=2305992 RepID=UPI0013D1A3D8|nr:ethylbenzene dehydrogenase-related protein [Agarivorans sp. Alg241-V36]
MAQGSRPSFIALSRKQTPRLTLWLSHVLLLPLLLTLFLSGMQIARANHPNSLAHYFGAWLPQGQVHLWHQISALVLVAAIVSYIIYQLLWGRFKRLVIAKQISGGNKFFRIGIAVSLLCLAGSVASGLAIYLLPVRPAWLNQIHPLLAWFTLGAGLLHVFTALVVRGLLNSGRFLLPQGSLGWRGTAVFSFAAVVSVVLWSVSATQYPRLLMVKIHQPLSLDGEGRNPLWSQAPALKVRTSNGANMPGGVTDIEIRALHDGQSGYFLLRWADATRSLTHLPLQKTAEGWKVLQSSALNADENQFYEDKFALMISRSGQFAGAGATHLGTKPHGERPGSASGRGLHYTLDGSITDVWHWKAVRTGTSIGQADDNYFGAPRPSKSEYKRYTAGYQKDLDCEHLVRWENNDALLKPECGGFVSNWREYSDDIVQPLRLPKSASVLKRMGSPNLDPELSDVGSWWLNWEDTEKYNPDNDHFPLGTVIPSVLSLGPLSQGRGDVSAKASWNHGFWTLELKRSLMAPDEYDLPLETGMYLWLSAFNHSQTRHSYHLQPLRLELQL